MPKYVITLSLKLSYENNSLDCAVIFLGLLKCKKGNGEDWPPSWRILKLVVGSGTSYLKLPSQFNWLQLLSLSVEVCCAFALWWSSSDAQIEEILEVLLLCFFNRYCKRFVRLVAYVIGCLLSAWREVVMHQQIGFAVLDLPVSETRHRCTPTWSRHQEKLWVDPIIVFSQIKGTVMDLRLGNFEKPLSQGVVTFSFKIVGFKKKFQTLCKCWIDVSMRPWAACIIRKRLRNAWGPTDNESAIGAEVQ